VSQHVYHVSHVSRVTTAVQSQMLVDKKGGKVTKSDQNLSENKIDKKGIINDFSGHQYCSQFWRSYALIAAPICLLPVAFSQGGSEEMRCAYVILLMATYWMTEALPLPVTSLMPMVLFPFMGIMSTNEVAINYLKSTNFMFLGGLILALAVEHSGLHQRVALKILLLIGTSPKNLLLGFMITTGKNKY
jgi:hypothetical protein